MFQIILLSRARKDVKKLDRIYAPKVSRYIDMLGVNPFIGEKLSGELKDWYKIKIPPLRIIYRPDIKNKTIWIKAIGFRGNIYKK